MSFKIYLLNPPFVPNFVRFARWLGTTARGGTLYYPMWLAYATGVLEGKYSVRLVDAVARKWSVDDVLRDVKEFAPDLIVVDCNFSSLSNDLNIASLLKKSSPKATTVIVGPPTSQYPEKILHHEGIDIVARYEYDFTLLDVARALKDDKNLENIKGISYKKDDKVIHNPDRSFTTSEDLDKMPFVTKVYKKHLNIRDYFLSESLYPEVQIFASRGCPFRCSFCSWPENFTGRQYRTRSPQNVIDELEYIKNELPYIEDVRFEDDTFTVEQDRIREICQGIKARKLKINWTCQTRADVDYKTLKMMKEAGCWLIIVGYESGNDEILKRILKGITTEQAQRFTLDAKKAGLMILGDFIIGLPGETRETAQKTIAFAKNLKPNLLQVAVAMPIPGTQFYNWAKENNFLLTENMEEAIDEQGYQKCIISYPDFPAAEIEKYVDKALKEYYLRPGYIPIAFSNILRRNGMHELRTMLRSAGHFFRYLQR